MLTVEENIAESTGNMFRIIEWLNNLLENDFFGESFLSYRYNISKNIVDIQTGMGMVIDHYNIPEEVLPAEYLHFILFNRAFWQLDKIEDVSKQSLKDYQLLNKTSVIYISNPLPPEERALLPSLSDDKYVTISYTNEIVRWGDEVLSIDISY